MSPDLAATTPLGHRTAPLATTPTNLTSGRSVLTPLLGQSQHVAPHGLPVRKGPLCSRWLLSVIYTSCYCLKAQSIQLPEACSKKASHLQHARLQARQLAKPSTSANCSFPCRICAWLLGSVQQMFPSCWWAKPLYSFGLLPPGPCPVQSLKKPLRRRGNSTTFVVLEGTSALPGKLKARGSSGKGKKLQAVLSCRPQSQSNLLYAYQ